MLSIHWDKVEEWQKLYSVDDDQLAVKMGYHPTTLYRVKRRQLGLSNDFIRALMKVTGFSFYTLIFWAEISQSQKQNLKPKRSAS